MWEGKDPTEFVKNEIQTSKDHNHCPWSQNLRHEGLIYSFADLES